MIQTVFTILSVSFRFSGNEMRCARCSWGKTLVKKQQ